jgi:tetratricopeptide (TPR) repeat protein
MAMQNIGSVHLAAGHLDAAETAFRRTLDVNPSWAAACTGLGAVLAQRGDRAGAIDAWSRAVQLNPSDFDALFNLATEFINANRAADARPYVEQFVQAAPRADYGPEIDKLRAWLLHRPSR